MKRAVSLVIALCLMISLCAFSASAKSQEQVAELSAVVDRMLSDGAYVDNVMNFILAQRDTLQTASEKELMLCFWYLETAIDVFGLQEANSIVHSEKDLEVLLESHDNLNRTKSTLEKLMEEYLAGNVEREKLVQTIIGLAEQIQEKQQKLNEQFGELAARIGKTGDSAEKTEQPASTSTPAPEAVHTPTSGEKNALASAQSYLNVSAFSYTGLIKQLEFSGFSNAEAIYAADHCGADWKEQAVRSAKQYLGLMAFSKSALINQLVFGGFTQAEAEYAVSQVY